MPRMGSTRVSVRPSWYGGGSIRARFWTPAYGLISGLLSASLALVAGGVPALNDGILANFLFIAVVTSVMSFWVVRQERGYIKLSSIGTIAAAMVLPPSLALAIGATSGLASIGTRPYGVRYLRLALPMFWTTAASVLRINIGTATSFGDGVVGQIAVIVTITILNWVMTALVFSISQGESLRSVWNKTFSVFWIGEFAYFGIAGMLVANTLNGTSRGYSLAILISVLSMALGESASQHRNRTLLEEHLTDTTRHLAYRRAADGLIHNLRNHLAATRGYIDEVALARQTVANRRRLAIASDACVDALIALDRMAHASTPPIHVEQVDANRAVVASSGLVAGRFASRRVALKVDPRSEAIFFAGDEELIREVLVNLLLNAFEAAPDAGWVRIGVEAKRDLVEIRVADNGPGISEEMRERLFEPHLTTKPNGTGMGLFTSYGVIREHRGKLLYAGSPQGAVFIVQLPLAPAGLGAPEVGEATVVPPSLAST